MNTINNQPISKPLKNILSYITKLVKVINPTSSTKLRYSSYLAKLTKAVSSTNSSSNLYPNRFTRFIKLSFSNPSSSITSLSSSTKPSFSPLFSSNFTKSSSITSLSSSTKPFISAKPFKNLALLTILATISLLSLSLTLGPSSSYALTSNTINYQAKLETTQGAIAADGTYNVEFKLYNALTSTGSTQGSCSGDSHCLWVEDYLVSNSTGVVVKDGYLTVNLGSITAFPSTINWDQQLYLTMNIGGTGTTPTWNGEMSPRIALTAVPYAFRSGQLAQYNSTTTYESTLSIAPPTGGNQQFIIPDQTLAGTYNLCIENSNTCGFAASSGSGNYVNLQATTPGTAQSGNFNISGKERTE